ncbi:hypothetical protein [Pseudomonas sp. BE134]|uniref:hypothetical protein n=1 Tax=Pseudomonas sp. BE134 TaxID=2817843 RepID=UPI0028550C0F|nr:hypothetical protein [Pseudomonas sp. BE134]MDR6925472.1 hypothetical protein [Pseudomonas sp. BE134]
MSTQDALISRFHINIEYAIVEKGDVYTYDTFSSGVINQPTAEARRLPYIILAIADELNKG